MRAPERLILPTCIGCGAITEFGTCEAGCTEQRVELVPAHEYDRLTSTLAAVRTRIDVFRAAAEQLTTQRPQRAEWETAYRSVQRVARSALRQHPEVRGEFDEPPERVSVWWCRECGGADAPQPCLGVCIRRPAEWVNAAVYESQRALALVEREREHVLRRLLTAVAFVTPRDEHWEQGWCALAARASQVLDTCEGLSRTTGTPFVGAAPEPRARA